MIATLPEDIVIDTPQVSVDDVNFLEEKIDYYNNENDSLKSFIIGIRLYFLNKLI